MNKFTSCCIIDDDEFFSFNAKRLMKETGFCYNILLYNNGQEAIDSMVGLLIENVSLPEIIFLDLNMPKKDGWEFLEEFQKIPLTKREHVEIFVVSSFISPEIMEKAKSYSMVRQFIVKPVNSKTLETIVQNKKAY